MATIVTEAQLRAILGVSSSLYNDAYLEDVINTAESVILPMLVDNSVAIDAVKLDNNIAYFSTVMLNKFAEGQSVVVTGCGTPFNGTHTITTDMLGDHVFSAAITNADIIQRQVIPSGLATISGASTYVGNSAVESAVLAVSVEVFQSRIAPGGQIEGIDFTSVSPYRLGRSLFNRVSGLLGRYLDVETMVQ